MASTEQLPKMQYRFLGRSGLQVSVISLGGWVTYGGHVGDQIAFDCMKAAYDVGINFFDCAEAYAGGVSPFEPHAFTCYASFLSRYFTF